MTKNFRGSRKHVLDWVESTLFLGELNEMVTVSGAVVSKSDKRMPDGHAAPGEARLESIRAGASMWALIRSIRVREVSPPALSRRPS